MSRVRLLDQVQNIIGVEHVSRRTARQAAKAYIYWIKRCILFHKKRHPGEMDTIEISAFLTHLAIERRVAASTQNQALNALVFLYKHVLTELLSRIDRLRWMTA